MQFVFFLQPAQDRDRVGDIGLGHENRLETPRQGGVLFDMFAIFVQGGGADAMQFTARQRQFQHRGVHRALGGAGANQVQFIDKK